MNHLSVGRAPESAVTSVKSNPLRGAGYRELASQFVQQYPRGTVVTWDEFVDWSVSVGLMDHPTPVTTDKQSDAWLAHLQRRNYARKKINKAGMHRDMHGIGGAFAVEVLDMNAGTLIVKGAMSSLIDAKAAQQVQSLAQTKKKQLEYLISSADWSVLPAPERMIAEELYNDISYYVEDVNTQGNRLTSKFERLHQRIKQLKDDGEINPVNGGISGLLDSDD